MEYKRIPFNITIAKCITHGSVNGRIQAVQYAGNCMATIGIARFIREEDGNYVFEICKPMSELGSHSVTYPMVFHKDGTACPLGEKTELIIEIPTESADGVSYEQAIDDLRKSHNTFVSSLTEDVHYHKCGIEPIEYILANGLGFCEGNIVKYITRYKYKGTPKDDLRKIKVYVDYLMEQLTEDGSE